MPLRSRLLHPLSYPALLFLVRAGVVCLILLGGRAFSTPSVEEAAQCADPSHALRYPKRRGRRTPPEPPPGAGESAPSPDLCDTRPRSRGLPGRGGDSLWRFVTAARKRTPSGPSSAWSAECCLKLTQTRRPRSGSSSLCCSSTHRVHRSFSRPGSEDSTMPPGLRAHKEVPDNDVLRWWLSEK